MAFHTGTVGTPPMAGTAARRSDRRRSIRRTVVGGAAAAVLAALLAPGAAVAAPAGAAPKRVGTAPPVPAGAVRTDAPAAGAALELSVTLAPRDPGALQGFVAAVSDPRSPQYRKYLGTGEFAGRFGAAPATVAQVTRALDEAGLHPGTPDPNGLTIPVTATVAEAAQAFDTDFDGYRLADGSTAYANTRAPSLSGSVASVVTGVVGLDDLAKPHSNHRATGNPVAASAPQGAAVAPRFNSGQPVLCSTVQNLLAAQGAHDGGNYYSPAALAQAYHLTYGSGGAGTTVALFELEDYSDSAVADYQRCYGTQAPVSRVKVNGGPLALPTTTGVGVESAIDIDTLIGLVPNASLLVYQGPDANNASNEDVLAVYRKMVNDNRAQIISTSWGSCEPLSKSAFSASADLIFQQAAAQGQTVVAASGDSGSSGCAYYYGSGPSAAQLATDDPASQRYVTGVGGTTLSGSPAAPSETVWNNGGASGGGVSQIWSLDSATGFQAAVTGSGYSSTPCAAPAGRACRQVPDVSASADPNHGYLISVGTPDTGGAWARYGGTSASAPLWAALVAHFNSSAQCAAAGPIGYLNPALYRLGTGALRDVLSGDNVLAGSGYTGSSYAAGPGYDLATGLGTPNADVLGTALCAAVPESPAGTFKSTTPVRLLDTRNGTGAPAGAVPGYGEKTLKIAGTAGVPAAGVTSVVLNVTVTDTHSDGHLTVYPAGGARPDTSNLNWTTGTTIPNLVTVPLGAGGAVTFYNAASASHLIVDLAGYYTTATDGATYLPSGPTRVMDSRTGTGMPGTSAGQVPAYGERTLNVRGLAGAPTGVSAVVLNVTVTNPQSDGHLTVYPSGGTPTATSNLNWRKGQSIPNQVIAPLGADGSIKILNGSWSPADVIVDVFGYLVTGGAGASFHSTDPHRLLDSRYGVGTTKGAFASQSTRVLALDGARLSGARAVVLNVTVTDPKDDGHLTVWPTSPTVPNTSSLNWTAGQTIPNLVTVPVAADGTVSINNGSWNTVDVIVDVCGYYS